MEPKMIKKQEVELDLITLKTTKLPYSLKQGDTNVHEITLKLDVEEGFEYERARVHYSNGDYQDIEGLTFIIKNSALKTGVRSFEVEFVANEEIRRSGKVKYRVDSSINSKYEAYNKYDELKKLYDVYVDAVDNEEKREQLKTELIELKNSIESDLENINLAVDDIVSSEDDRKQNEIVREQVRIELENLVADIQNKLDDGDFDGKDGEQGIQGETGKSIEYTWNGTQLGVRIEGETNYTYVNLKGDKGDIGNTGKSLEFTWNGTQLGIRIEGETAYQYVNLKGEKGDPGEVTQVEFDNLSQEVTAHKEDYTTQRQLPHFNHAAQEYINLDKFWNNLRDGKIYTSEFNQYAISPSSVGVKKHDNEGLIMEPSTNTVAGKDDYSKIGLFKPIEVNAYVDENDDYHVVAIQGDGRFKRDGTMGDVWIMNMVGYIKYYSDDEKWSISYSDTAYGGFEVIDEAVKPDGTIRPYLLHAKYVAGRNPHESNNLASISGVPAEYSGMSHNGQITEFKAKGTQYSGKTSHDDFWVQLLMWIKYATMNSDSIMGGCQSYYLQYTNLEAEADVKRVIITSSQANGLLIGSAVSIGDYGTGSINADRQAAQNYNLANRVNITAIEDLGGGNSAVYVDSDNAFNTTLTTTITTYPWNSGGCDNVLGVDGSPYSNTSSKEPFIIGGIEMMVGGYEVLQNLIILNNAVDNRIDVYVNYDCKTYATSITSAYALAGELVQTNNAWKYGSKISIPKNHPSIILITEAEASSTTGTGDGIYTNPPSAGGTRVWQSLGNLHNGAFTGLRYLYAINSLASTHWTFLGRLSATGRSRGE